MSRGEDEEEEGSLSGARRADAGVRRVGPAQRPGVLVVLGLAALALALVEVTGASTPVRVLMVGAGYVLIVFASVWGGRVRAALAFAALATAALLRPLWLALEDAPTPEEWTARGLVIGLVLLTAALVALLLRSQRRFGLALEASPIPVLLTDQAGEVLLGNRRAEQLLGYPRGGLVGCPVEDLVPERYRARFAAAREAYFEGDLASRQTATGEPGESRELVVRRHDGSEMPVEIDLHPLRTESGVVLYTSLHDLSKRRTLEREKDRLAALVQTSADAILVTDAEGTVASWNAGAEALYGRSAEEIVGLPLWVVAPVEREEEVRDLVARVVAGDPVRALETEHVASDGRRLRVALSATPLREGRGTPDGVALIVRDVTAQKQAELLLVEMNLALSNAMPGHAYVDSGGRVMMRNGELDALLGTRIEPAVQAPLDPLHDTQFLERAELRAAAARPHWLDGFAEEARTDLERAYERMLKEGKAEVIARVKGERGEDRFLELLLVRRTGPNERYRGLHLFAREVTHRVRAQERLSELAQELERSNDDLEHLAQVDPLTGLMNRRGLERFLVAESRRARRDGSTLVAILIDIDDFKAFNEVHGHHGGDRVLGEVARRLREVLRAYDGAARIGGDEFLAVLPSTRLAEARMVAERLRTIVAGEPMLLEGGEGETLPVRVTCSLGLAEVPAEASSIATLLLRTREALKKSKTLGKDRVSDEEGNADDLELQLLRILDEGLIQIVQQPIFDLREDTVVAYELLARGPDGPLHAPNDLFALASANDLLVRTDLVCLRKAVAAARLLPAGRRVHVNVFPQTLADRGVEAVLTILEELPGDRKVCVELNEQAFVGDPSELRKNVDALRAAGHQIALDDVGFGKSALETLIVLEPEIVKLDRRVVHGASKDPAARRTLDRIAGVVQSLRALPIAEGVEDPADCAVLLESGVRAAQGYFLARPQVPAAPLGDRDLLEPFRAEEPEHASDLADDTDGAPR